MKRMRMMLSCSGEERCPSSDALGVVVRRCQFCPGYVVMIADGASSSERFRPLERDGAVGVRRLYGLQDLADHRGSRGARRDLDRGLCRSSPGELVHLADLK